MASWSSVRFWCGCGALRLALLVCCVLWWKDFLPSWGMGPTSADVECSRLRRMKWGEQKAHSEKLQEVFKLRFDCCRWWMMEATWLILPVVICLSQRLSHACLSVNYFILWNCEWLIKSVIVYLMVPIYSDNRSNSRANTCTKSRLLKGCIY